MTVPREISEMQKADMVAALQALKENDAWKEVHEALREQGLHIEHDLVFEHDPSDAVGIALQRGKHHGMLFATQLPDILIRAIRGEEVARTEGTPNG